MKFLTRIFTLWFVNSIRKKTGNQTASTNFVSNSHFFVLLLPDGEKEFLASLQVLNFLLSQKKEVTIIHNNAKAHYIHQKYSIRSVEYYQTDSNKIGLPTSTFRKKLSEVKTDVVIDLSRDENYFSIFSAYCIPAKIRVGFEKNDSDKFYTIQIRSSEINHEISYKNFLNCLQMF